MEAGRLIVVSIKARDIIAWGRAEGHSFQYVGDEGAELNGFSSLRKYKEGSITWIKRKNPVDQDMLLKIRCAVIQKGAKEHPKNYFMTEEAKRFFFAVVEHFFSDCGGGIAEKEHTYIGEDVKLGKNVKIGCGCVLDGKISVGDNTVIGHNVTVIGRVAVGADCTIYPGTVIGKDGFGFYLDKDNIPWKVPHFGGVQIGDRVEIGCNCTVDRGTIDDTIIGDDVKIDSLVVIAHNVEIGEGTMVVGGVAIGGSCKIGRKSYIAPQAIIKNQISIGDNSFVGMGECLASHLGDSKIYVRGREEANKNYRRFL